MTSSTRITIALGTAVVLVLGFVVVALVVGPVRKAERLRRLVLGLRIGETEFHDVQKLVSSFHGAVVTTGAQPVSCTPKGCTWVVSIENFALRNSHLAPRMGLVAFLEISDNRLSSRYLAMYCDREESYLEVFVEERSRLQAGEKYRFARYGSVPRIGVELTPEAPESIRDLPHGLNLNCLEKIGGCTSTREMLPALEHLTSESVN